jgi:26S proteasome regulatory subunit T3
MATNRADTLDPALLRPGRLDRKIEFPRKNDRRQKRAVYTTLAGKMSLSQEVDLDTFILRPDSATGAVVAAIMQNAGLLAVRRGRYLILQSDIEEAYNTQIGEGKSDKFEFYR